MKLTELTVEERDALFEEFGVGGSCGCDGAIDFGCPLCDPKQLHEWVEERHRQRMEKSRKGENHG
jgi:hypothetical protein